METCYGGYETARLKTFSEIGSKENILNMFKSENYQWKNKEIVDEMNELIKEN
jgi:hypothetical protein